MSEPFAAVEEMIRCFGKDVNPAVSLRHRILAASLAARERQLRRIRIVRNSCWSLACLGVVYAGAHVPWSHFQTIVDSNSSELSAAMSPVLNDAQFLSDFERSDAFNPPEEIASPIFSESVEWEMAESHQKRRDRQSEVISHYF